MKYRLKDRELQKKLDEISGGDFGVRVHEAFSRNKNALAIRVFFRGSDGTNNRFSAFVLQNELEKTDEYNPRAWNDYPEVKPPLGVWMRCEFDHRGNGSIERNVAKYIEEDGEFYWVDERGDDVCNIDRFRPWED